MAQQTALNKLSTDFRDWQRSWDMYDKDPKNYKKPKNFDEFIQPYLAMEKEQIKFAYNDGADAIVANKYKAMEDYYNELYQSSQDKTDK